MSTPAMACKDVSIPGEPEGDGGGWQWIERGHRGLAADKLGPLGEAVGSGGHVLGDDDARVLKVDASGGRGRGCEVDRVRARLGARPRRQRQRGCRRRAAHRDRRRRAHRRRAAGSLWLRSNVVSWWSFPNRSALLSPVACRFIQITFNEKYNTPSIVTGDNCDTNAVSGVPDRTLHFQLSRNNHSCHPAAAHSSPVHSQ